MKNRNLIIGGLVGLITIVVIVVLFMKGNEYSGFNEKSFTQEVSTEEPIDIVLDFYEAWLGALQSTSTDPYKLGLATTSILSKDLSAKLVSAQFASSTEADPVLCQTTVPEKIRAKAIFELDDKVQFLVSSKELPGQAIVDLIRHNEGWYIGNITCSQGESAPIREFTFEKDGFLLKSVPPPLDPQYWHIVYEENGQNGHAAPLFFDAESTCTAFDGSEGVCDPNTFTDAKAASIKGEMTESGIDVKKLKILE